MIGDGRWACSIPVFIAVHVPNKSVILPDKKMLHEAREKLILFSHCYIKLASLLEKIFVTTFSQICSVLPRAHTTGQDRARQICHVPGLFLKQNVLLSKFLNSKKKSSILLKIFLLC